MAASQVLGLVAGLAHDTRYRGDAASPVWLSWRDVVVAAA